MPSRSPRKTCPSGLAFEHVVTLILGVIDTEFLSDIRGKRVYLQGEIATLHGVKKVETNGKLSPEALVNHFAQQLLRLLMNQRESGKLKLLSAETKHQGYFLPERSQSPRRS